MCPACLSATWLIIGGTSAGSLLTGLLLKLGCAVAPATDAVPRGPAPDVAKNPDSAEHA